MRAPSLAAVPEGSVRKDLATIAAESEEAAQAGAETAAVPGASAAA